MSASLVGSEMCIRDRDPLPRLRRRRAFRAQLRLRARPLRRPRLLRGPCPVSYTHLTLPTICSV
eukprot:9920077-Alexandrium_andersonii.AAC.1